MMQSQVKSSYLLIIFVAAVTLPCLVSAQSFSLKPAKQEVVLHPGTSAQESIAITNNLGYNSYFTIRFKNINLDNPASYPLTDFARLREEEVFVADGQTKTVYFDISIPPQVRPGGAYGYFQVIAKSGREVLGDPSVSAALDSSLFIRIKGSIKEEGKLVSFGIIGRRQKFTSPFWWHFSFENTGNIYLNPYGKILLTNKFTGTETLIDVPPRSVLPGQTKLFEAKSSALGFPGLYSAILLLNRGYNDEVDIMETSFWFLSWPLLVALAVICLVLVLAVILKMIHKINV